MIINTIVVAYIYRNPHQIIITERDPCAKVTVIGAVKLRHERG